MVGKYRKVSMAFVSWKLAKIVRMKLWLGIEDGSVMPLWFRVVLLVVMPIERVKMMALRNGFFRYDGLQDVVWVGEYKYSVEALMMLSHIADKGDLLKFVKRKDGMVYVERYDALLQHPKHHNCRCVVDEKDNG
jgi:hypothetical protein